MASQAKIKKKAKPAERSREPALAAVELARTVSQLAAANQQLATAHNRTLEHCQALLAEALSRRAADAPPAGCPNCRDGSRVRSTAKPRLVLNKRSAELTGANAASKKLRRARKAAATDEPEKSELGEELEALRLFKLESQKRNEELLRDVERQSALIERLTRDCQDSQNECERKDASLEAARDQLGKSELEAAGLLARLETFQCEGREEAEERRGQALDEEPSAGPASASIEEFKKDLALKREARQRAMTAISAEMERLRRELESEKLAHSETARALAELRSAGPAEEDPEDRVEALRLLDLLKVSDEVSLNLRLQLERTDDLRFQLETEPEEHRQRISSLRRLAEEARASLHSRRVQTAGLKDRLAQLLVRLGEEPKLRLLAGSDEIRREAERQLEDIARSRQLCDERSRILAELKDYCSQQLAEVRVKLASLGQEHQSLEEELRRTEDKIDAQDSEILNLESQLGLAKADCRELQNQMSLINSLFSQMLLGASSAEMDLDRLTQLLQENHDLISGMAKEKGTEAAALPKLLLDIIEQVDGRGREACSDERKEDELQEESIAHNLPKVWRILLELLSCQASSTSSADATDSTAVTNPGATDPGLESSPDSCYKSVDTPTGPRLVISVSKTYIRLKELILEKKHLEKEMNRMKQLNTHLETKLSEQEKRLSTVSDELSKTWNIVGRMQAQHQQLHTHEKILRYELQQKRKMLQELKQELEYCREKWESARQKNTNTEIEWKSLRREFAARKALVSHASAFSNSGESGFSDEREEESDEEEERDIGKRVRSRRRSKKDGARVMSPDTESEQPTDTELSESKPPSSSSTTSGEQTPAPETEPTPGPSVGEEDAADTAGSATTAAVPDASESPESSELLNPLDKALAKVIENLLESDERKPLKTAQTGPGESAATKARPETEEEGCAAAPGESGAVNPIFSIGPIPARETEAQSRSGVDCRFGSPSDGCAASSSGAAATKSREEQLDARAARLKSLEEQAQWLVKKVNDTNRRGSALNSRLEELHEAYGSIPSAPPMPDVLPAFRLTSELEDETKDD